MHCAWAPCIAHDSPSQMDERANASNSCHADFGNAHWDGNTGVGPTGPWAGADLESGMYYGGGSKTNVNNQSQPLPLDFVSLVLTGRADGFMLKGDDATSGTQTVMYNGSRPYEADPSGCIAPQRGRYKPGRCQPMKKQGPIILATGGDNSNSASGNFYEGFVATGYASEETDVKIQEKIIAVGYSGWNRPTGAPDDL